MKTYTRSELATRCGVNKETLRYYEEQRLIDPPRRNASGYRIYTQEDAAKINFVKNAKELGFTLKEIRELLGLRVQGKQNCETVLSRARQKKMKSRRKWMIWLVLKKVWIV